MGGKDRNDIQSIQFFVIILICYIYSIQFISIHFNSIQFNLFNTINSTNLSNSFNLFNSIHYMNSTHHNHSIHYNHSCVLFAALKSKVRICFIYFKDNFLPHKVILFFLIPSINSRDMAFFEAMVIFSLVRCFFSSK